MLRTPADHDAVALRKTPNAAGNPRVDEADALRGELLTPAHRVAEVAVATVDKEVAFREEAGKRLDCLLGRIARGDHHPRHTRRFQGGDEPGEVCHVADFRVAVEPDDLVPILAQPRRHVAAHLAEPHETETHRAPPLVVRRVEGYRPGRSRWGVGTGRC